MMAYTHNLAGFRRRVNRKAGMHRSEVRLLIVCQMMRTRCDQDPKASPKPVTSSSAHLQSRVQKILGMEVEMMPDGRFPGGGAVPNPQNAQT